MRAQVAGAELVSNPGCYPTSVLLPLAPLIAEDLIAPGATIVVNSASGVTGAGNSPKRELLFAEVGEDYRAYGVGNTHRHLHEMRAVSTALGADVDFIFTPHLLPVARGILSTITVPLRHELGDVLAPWRRAYGSEPFIEISDTPPTLREVAYRNVARISATSIEGVRHPTLLVLCAIDNLVKGAAGQAIQNANLMLGLDEQAGLPA
jgi:N-acetyl-gamma-glutamyl-phosphate reductase